MFFQSFVIVTTTVNAQPNHRAAQLINFIVLKQSHSPSVTAGKIFQTYKVTSFNSFSVWINNFKEQLKQNKNKYCKCSI